eukprot:GHVU01188482.1.p1 GENE.GHVU01188482.1~~GHVU01188482.1.p1  ORF type:complete len:283 (-),score=56.32 GHVU01188482.1:25-873(-)
MLGNCDLYLADLGAVPEEVPEGAQLKHACPKSCDFCGSCELPDPDECADNPVVLEYNVSCSELQANPGCSSLLEDAFPPSASLPAGVPQGTRVQDVCRQTCNACDDTSTTVVCEDNPMVEDANYSCDLFMQFARDGCNSYVVELFSEGMQTPAGVPQTAKIKDACPKTCGVCTPNPGPISEATVPAPSSSGKPISSAGFLCEDNPMIEEFGLKCKTLARDIGSLGCDRKLEDLAAEHGKDLDAIPAAFLSHRVADACPESCGLCTGREEEEEEEANSRLVTE